MSDVSWVGYVTAIGSVATPLLVLALTAVGWRVRSRIERLTELEDRLREDRVGIYNDILEPFIISLMSDAAWQADPKNRSRDKLAVTASKILSLEYRRLSFQLVLIGSDEVVSSFNDLFQYFYSHSDGKGSPSKSDADAAKDMANLLGKFLLEIRRSMGNEATKLESWDMLEWFMTDARQFRNS